MLTKLEKIFYLIYYFTINLIILNCNYYLIKFSNNPIDEFYHLIKSSFLKILIMNFQNIRIKDTDILKIKLLFYLNNFLFSLLYYY